jgi:hypothetical protein
MAKPDGATSNKQKMDEQKDKRNGRKGFILSIADGNHWCFSRNTAIDAPVRTDRCSAVLLAAEHKYNLHQEGVSRL